MLFGRVQQVRMLDNHVGSNRFHLDPAPLAFEHQMDEYFVVVHVATAVLYDLLDNRVRFIREQFDFDFHRPIPFLPARAL
jgi:hypothetical protein